MTATNASANRLLDEFDEGMQEDRARREADRRYCHVCQSRGGHTDGCPEESDDDEGYP